LLLKERGEVAEAEAQVRAAIESDNRARYHINLGDLLAKTGRLEEAKTEYNSALAVEPDSDRAKKALTELAKNELKQSAD
jgi:predicted negative regulator of RcsB-dependent stress response